MKQYPSIPNSNQAPHEDCYLFVKYDGSNLRFEYSTKKGWHKFGTRHLMFDHRTAIFGEAIPLFLGEHAEGLEKSFKHKDFRGVDRFVVFAEFFGARSFAGYHEPDDPKDLVIFDVNPHRKGLLGPRLFLDHFGHLHVAESLGIGTLDDDLVEAVRGGDYDRVDFRSGYPIRTAVPEGVICKAGSGHDLWMCKIKSRRYFEEIRSRYPREWESMWE